MNKRQLLSYHNRNIQLKKAIRQVYQSTRLFNEIGGNNKLIEKRKPVQIIFLKDEITELVDAVMKGDSANIAKEAIDCLVVCCELIMICDKNSDLIADEPRYINTNNLSFSELLGHIVSCVASSNWIDTLGYLEDLMSVLPGDTVKNLMSVCKSNLSKYPLKDTVDKKGGPKEVEDKIRQLARYAGISHKEVLTSEGKLVYVFTAERELHSKVNYSAPKIMKPIGYYKEAIISMKAV